MSAHEAISHLRRHISQQLFTPPLHVFHDPNEICPAPHTSSVTVSSSKYDPANEAALVVFQPRVDFLATGDTIFQTCGDAIQFSKSTDSLTYNALTH